MKCPMRGPHTKLPLGAGTSPRTTSSRGSAQLREPCTPLPSAVPWVEAPLPSWLCSKCKSSDKRAQSADPGQRARATWDAWRYLDRQQVPASSSWSPRAPGSQPHQGVLVSFILFHTQIQHHPVILTFCLYFIKFKNKVWPSRELTNTLLLMKKRNLSFFLLVMYKVQQLIFR